MAIEITDEIVKAFRTAELRALQIQGFHYGNYFVIRDLRKNVTEQEILRYPDADQEGFVDAILALRAKDTLNAVAPLIEAQVSAEINRLREDRDSHQRGAIKAIMDLAQARADAIEDAAKLIEDHTIQYSSAGVQLVQRQADDQSGLQYAKVLRDLAAIDGYQASLRGAKEIDRLDAIARGLRKHQDNLLRRITRARGQLAELRAAQTRPIPNSDKEA